MLKNQTSPVYDLLWRLTLKHVSGKKKSSEQFRKNDIKSYKFTKEEEDYIDS